MLSKESGRAFPIIYVYMCLRVCLAHAVARTQCACKNFVLDQYGDHVLTCKKHTGAIAGHDHVMNVTAQLARNSGLKVRVNRKVDITAADNNKQGDVQAMDFGIPGYEHLVWDVSLVSDRIGSSLQHGLNGKLQLGDYLNARARTKIGKFRRDYAAKNIAFAPAILSVAGKIHPEFQMAHNIHSICRPANRRLKNIVLVLFKTLKPLAVLWLTQNHRKIH